MDITVSEEQKTRLRRLLSNVYTRPQREIEFAEDINEDVVSHSAALGFYEDMQSDATALADFVRELFPGFWTAKS